MLADAFDRSFSDNKSPQISRILLNILPDLNNTVTWIISTCPLISKSSSHFTKTLGSFQVFELQLVSPSPSYSMFFMFSCKVLVFIDLFVYFFHFLPGVF